MSFKENQDAARKAVKFVDRIMVIGANNRNDGKSVSNPSKAVCASQVKSQALTELARRQSSAFAEEKAYQAGKLEGPVRTQPSPIDMSLIEREIATKKQCGNCAEQVAIAMWHLIDEGVPVQIDFYDLQPMDIDHQFLVIGRTTVSSPESPATWGGDAIVCDPWHDSAVYSTSQLAQRLYRGETSPDAPVGLMHMMEARWASTHHNVELSRRWKRN